MSSVRRTVHTWLPLLILLVALAVRTQNLLYHSLWFDEAMSVHWARSDISRILEVSMNLVEDRLPPLYYLLLHGWGLAAGYGEVALRLLSVFPGVLLVAVVYRLAADLFDRRVAALAAALAAFSPFLVWYSQEARMYSLAALLGTLGTWCFISAVRASDAQHVSAPSKRAEEHRHAQRTTVPLRTQWTTAAYWVGYGLSVLAGLYTHFYTGFLVPAHALYLLLTPPAKTGDYRPPAKTGDYRPRRSCRAWLPFVATLLVVAALFAPLALAAMRASGEAGAGHPLTGLGDRLWTLLAAFTTWKAPLPEGVVVAIGALMGLLALLGVTLPHRFASRPSEPHPLAPSPQSGEGGIPPLRFMERESGGEVLRARMLLALLLVMPLALATILLLRNRLAFFGERYFIIMVPWLLMAAALGAVRLAGVAQRLPHCPRVGVTALCYLLPLVLTTIPLPGQWSPPARKEAWRETVAYLATHARAEDAILIHPDWTRYPLQYYFRGPGQTYAVFSSVDKHTDLDGPLASISSRHPVVWLIESHTELADPEHRVNAWLAARYPLVTELYPPGLAVHAYAPGYLTEHLPEFAAPTAILFEGGPKLVGYVLQDTRIRAADDLFHPPSGWVHVVTYWEAEGPLGQDYAPFVHMVDGIGQVWGASLERRNDAFHVYPPARWLPGQVVRADFDVNLNPATPAGTYTLVVGLRDAAGVHLPLSDGAPQAALGVIEILE